jgi:hypothetical protein
MNDWLSFKTSHISWFKENGIGCSTRHVNETSNGTRKTSVTSGCALEFEVSVSLVLNGLTIVACFEKLM